MGKGSERMKRGREKKRRFFSEDHWLQVQDVMIVFTGKFLYPLLCSSFLQCYTTYYQVGSQGFTSTTNCTRGRTHVSVFRMKFHLLYGSFWDWPSSFLLSPLSMQMCLPLLNHSASASSLSLMPTGSLSRHQHSHPPSALLWWMTKL